MVNRQNQHAGINPRALSNQVEKSPTHCVSRRIPTYPFNATLPLLHPTMQRILRNPETVSSVTKNRLLASRRGRTRSNIQRVQRRGRSAVDRRSSIPPETRRENRKDTPIESRQEQLTVRPYRRGPCPRLNISMWPTGIEQQLDALIARIISVETLSGWHADDGL